MIVTYSKLGQKVSNRYYLKKKKHSQNAKEIFFSRKQRESFKNMIERISKLGQKILSKK